MSIYIVYYRCNRGRTLGFRIRPAKRTERFAGWRFCARAAQNRRIHATGTAKPEFHLAARAIRSQRGLSAWNEQVLFQQSVTQRRTARPSRNPLVSCVEKPHLRLSKTNAVSFTLSSYFTKATVFCGQRPAKLPSDGPPSTILRSSAEGGSPDLRRLVRPGY
jgi:hypothetical protein